MNKFLCLSLSALEHTQRLIIRSIGEYNKEIEKAAPYEDVLKAVNTITQLQEDYTAVKEAIDTHSKKD